MAGRLLYFKGQDEMGNSTVKEGHTDDPIKLTKELINQYRKSLEDRGFGQQTISMYFCYLNRLYNFLQGDKEITDESLKQWVASLKEEGLSDRTINLHITSVNGLLRFCGYNDTPVSVLSVHRREKWKELTRDEYLHLLSCAKKHGSERDYLLIKTLATIGIYVSDLPFITVEACRKGVVELPDNREIVIPDSFNQELLSYIESHGLETGPIFVTKYGKNIARANIASYIKRMGKEAGIEKGKCTASALHRLYENTQKEITQHLMSLHMQEYDKLLNEEKKKVS